MTELPIKNDGRPLRRGWTTGACATAATKAAYQALVAGAFPDPVEIVLPKGERPRFALAREDRGEDWCEAAIVKDAGDDPDVTHGALVSVRVTALPAGSGIRFKAGKGVGEVTLPGLPIGVGEPAINPVPRRMMRQVVAEIATEAGAGGDVEIEISIADGAALALKTANPRLGIMGGLSVLGTTGIVRPFSCAAWIASIHRGVDVARAASARHLAGCTGSTSQDAVRALYGLPEIAMLDMGDFAGGVIKYLRQHPVDRLTIGGGPGKMVKLAQGLLDLHSRRGSVDFDWLARVLEEAGAPGGLVASTRAANTAKQVFDTAAREGVPLGCEVAARALQTVRATLREAPVLVDVVVVDRDGVIIGRADE
ncbi:cobalt-precorrin-5B (C1)-methyltransferase [Breoghania corrubedonensis]|uniref:Cobalt-precorrin-5B C(1)-methyltransferase n=2 Tax=Breoghania corrubedonensis TaxID=665038 RepID=A0A2T5VFS5_9HYPH|nr:cobalt-precorrin-5B (C(1))-methyltransferase [Breoghania corrubedonensis]PTW62605.1 cobalt-precorrin-5B (C1)-methyltransferase [Breoghania corrubedonensis]